VEGTSLNAPSHCAAQDEDPYVRKTGVVCVGKLFDINNEFVESMGFLDTLRSMLSDSNPMVCASCNSSGKCDCWRLKHFAFGGVGCIALRENRGAANSAALGAYFPIGHRQYVVQTVRWSKKLSSLKYKLSGRLRKRMNWN
jgi:hypothetical protein